MSTVGFSEHDHQGCIATNLKKVEAECASLGLQFTPVRRRVLEYLLTDHCALGAYEILDRLKADGMGAQPPVAYRALDFLVKHGFAHKIERLNAFVACSEPTQSHMPTFLICRKCDAVAEACTAAPEAAVDQIASTAGFQVETVSLEAQGICPNCAKVAV